MQNLKMFISKEGLQSLHNYSFKGEDHSFCANHILAPFIWEPLLKNVIPRWLAPNILTTIGFISMTVAWIILAITVPTGTEPIHPVIYLLTIICIFIYQIADNVDGRQARRTKNATPLGELFDHGNDSLMIGIFALVVVLALKTTTLLTLSVLLMLYLIFFLSHWEEYHTGVLILGPLLNPTELQLMVIGMLLGETIYSDIITISIFGFQVNTTIAFCVIFGAFGALAMYSYNVYAFIKETKKCSFKDSLKRLFPFMQFFLLTGVLFLLTDEVFIRNNFHSIVAITILLNAFITQRIILNRICKEEVDSYYYINIIYAIYVFLMICNVQKDLITFIMLLISIGQEALFAIIVSLTMSKEIGINVWTVKQWAE
ncbi:CDP-alcohol phosphatidyltransferase family protein [Entamoeba histolytica HM-1:IMSS-B]|uniref:CDP-alcohol phosphatidyltransferase family protein n=6 Tax=Entamoeba histolytica TaxID=5759 RepID=C4LTY8_ENTH1|nr:CDP-alcohol phosphatidyltransferase family protein [Entamoeba histolytica HM-1:IMSS]EMD46906.1 CDPalcohol phosphatidyltransferase family protein [Entamoeba histolytica KU27]EMH76533.1 CDP-alcohol phosphatidyltransferase family protein [Entamoeba histolytica HM-1:IMSS-B]EMS14280.1 CDP-alcohol phosphatidyltransferase family protein [Entamoeba histolytica HM-3:IMSS]ENY63640.1 CDP-alcohol phosphatidyltransferase family protein, putative [Entamoeba histolytica HM-1:IMSS-A]GAT92050.1 CDP-alcohol |eukprot:XP_656778.2 CDP-alcohol phosphatidyltransferase family protein [Entamoeba histolytica HM-1:IMSS]